jgi:hypothetical protein
LELCCVPITVVQLTVASVGFRLLRLLRLLRLSVAMGLLILEKSAMERTSKM